VFFEPKKKGRVGDYYTLKEIVARIKKYSQSKIELIAEVPANIPLSGGYLPVTFKFKNIGKKPVLLLPPSYCFSSLWIKKTIINNPHSEENWGYGIDHWEFLHELEPLLKLDVGAERTYNYRIPFAVLHLTTADTYRVHFDYH